MRFSLVRTFVVLAPAALLTACATTKGPEPMAARSSLPIDQHPLRTETAARSISLRINASGLSDNQRRALDQVAEEARWTRGDAVDVEVITAGDPDAVAAGSRISAYLAGHDVPHEAITLSSRTDHPADIVTVTLTQTSAVVQTCNQSWENLAATRNNGTYANFGCAVNANLAAQIADPRDIERGAPPTASDALRKSDILTKYRKGEVTSSAKDEQAAGTVSDAVK